MKKPKALTVIIIFAVLALIILLNVLHLLNPVKSLLSSALLPFYDYTYSLGSKIGQVFSKSSNLRELQQENENLRGENTRLIQNLSLLQEAEQENLELRQLLDFFESQASQYPRVIARVIGKDPENDNILLLNVGQRDGVKIDNAFIVNDGIFVAKIIAVDSKTAQAILVTDTNSQIAVTISGGSPTNKIARGDRGLSVILDQIPQQERISKGQIVITSGLESNIPRGLIMGEIEELISENNDLFQKAVLRPLIDYKTIHLGAVILSQ